MDKSEKYEIIKSLPIPTIEALDVLFGSKPVLYGTLIASNYSEIKSIENKTKTLDLAIKFQKESKPIKDMFENNRDNKHNINFALSKYETKAKNFLKYESNNKHSMMGELLGYPKCCSKSFDKYFPTQNSKWTGKKIARYLMKRLNDFKTYPFYTNRLLRFSEYGALLYHFPCSLDCKKSVEIGKRRYDILKDVDPDRADKIKNNLSSVILFEINEESDGFYEEVTNVAYSPDYEYNNMELNINGDVLRGSEYTDDKFYKRMQSVNNIKIKPNGNYIVDGEKVSRNNFKIIAFR